VADPRYWRDEIDHVIKARGIREFPEYAGAERRAREVALRREHREDVWDLFVAYQDRLADAGLLDFNDVLAMAVDEVGQRPPEPGYAAVIVDEVTDLNLLGLRLVRALAGDRPDSLLLVGDGRQAVYPGGARLREAGIDITGRAVVLRTNYRNTDEILRAARRLVPTVHSVDPDDRGDGQVIVSRHGRPAIWVETRGLAAHDAALLGDLRAAARRLGGFGGLAVLCRTRRQVESYLRLLADNGIPGIPLTDYTGLPVDRVKVGTYKRAKGLDFAAVFLPLLPPPTDPESSEPVTVERGELLNRELHVASTRARDEVWLGRLGRP
jgi:superfamily I DNA/RNA helicase